VLGNDKVIILTHNNSLKIIKVNPKTQPISMMDIPLLPDQLPQSTPLQAKDLVLCPANDFLAISFLSQTSPKLNKILLYKISKRGLISPIEKSDGKAQILYSCQEVQEFNIPVLMNGFNSLGLQIDIALPLYYDGKLIMAVFNDKSLGLLEFCPKLGSLKQIFDKKMEKEFFCCFRGFGFGSLSYFFGVDNECLHRVKIK